jgi:hypothetical protein
VPVLPWEAWLIIGGIAVAMLLSMLHALASAVRVETHVHETKVKAASLQRAYAEQLAALEAEKNRNNQVEIVGQGPR